MNKFALVVLLQLFFLNNIRAGVVKPNATNHVEIASYFKKNRENLIAAVKDKNFIGVEILIGDGTAKRFQSYFGHSSIRFLDDDDDMFNDLVISYQLFSIDDKQALEKALEGGWENLPHVTNFRDTVYDYTRLDMGGVKRIVIPSSPERIRKLVTFIASAVLVPDLVGDYLFIKNNCLDALLKTLAAADYPIIKYGIAVPVLADNILRQSSFVTYFPPLYISPRVFELKKEADQRFKVRSQWSWSKKNKVNYVKTEAFKHWLSQLEKKDIEVLYTFWPTEWMPMTHVISDLYDSLRSHSRLEEILGFESYPKSFYQLCEVEDSNCRARRLEDILSYWSQGDLSSLNNNKNYSRRFFSDRKRARQLTGKGHDIFELLNSSNEVYADYLKLDIEIEAVLNNI